MNQGNEKISDESGNTITVSGTTAAPVLEDPSQDPAQDFFVRKGKDLTFVSTDTFTMTNFQKVGDDGASYSTPLPVGLKNNNDTKGKAITGGFEATQGDDEKYYLAFKVGSGNGLAGHYSYTLTINGQSHDPDMEVES